MHVGQVGFETTFGEWIDTNVSQESHLHKELVNSPKTSDFSNVRIIESPIHPGWAVVLCGSLQRMMEMRATSVIQK